MDPLASSYFDGWSHRDPSAIAAAFAPDGTFADPDGSRPAADVGIHASRLFERFPDLSFEVRDASAPSGSTVAARWTMRTGSRFVQGGDFLTVGAAGIMAAERLFDPRTLAAPADGMSVGTVVRVGSARRARPGAIGVTWQEAPTEAGQESARRASDRILGELPATPGFIGGIAANIGDRFLTVTAWEQPNDPYALIREGSHRMAAVQFFGPDAYSAGWTGVWVPERLHSRWVRCLACGKMADSGRAAGTCACGTVLPEAPAYW